jgi:hypothetical protein
VDWEDPLIYDLVINTDRIGVEEGARLAQRALESDRFQSTDASRQTLRDMGVASQVRAVLLGDAVTRARPITVQCTDGVVALGGRVEEWSVRRAAEQALARVPGIREIRFLTPAAIDGEGAQPTGDDLHGEAHRWGGFGRNQ